MQDTCQRSHAEKAIGFVCIILAHPLIYWWMCSSCAEHFKVADLCVFCDDVLMAVVMERLSANYQLSTHAQMHEWIFDLIVGGMKS